MMLLSALRHAAFTEEGGLLFVHAAVDPARSLAAQGDAFWWGRSDILDLTAAVRWVSPRRRGALTASSAGSSNASSQFRSMAAPGRGGRLLAACFAADGNILERVEA